MPSDLQGQVKKFRKEASDAIEERRNIGMMLIATRQQNEELVLQKRDLAVQLQQARMLCTALVGHIGMTTIPLSVLQQIDEGFLAGIDLNRDEETGDLTVSPTYGAVEEEPSDAHESDSDSGPDPDGGAVDALPVGGEADEQALSEEEE